ncbi:MAG TPA: CheR family methyltransferase [Gaiellaceae bacterium]|nr:CheR family methyltransferase [Gaiellaceae bacterium]
MSAPLATGTLDQVADLVRRASGIRVARSQYPSLATAISRAAGGDVLGFLDLTADPVWGREAVARLVDEIAIKETHFFREPRPLEAIPWHALFERARQAGRRVRVWSAACATGEEPYTLALLACEAFGSPAPPVDVLATDISSTALERALAGSYRERSVRLLDPALRDRHLARHGDHFAVRDHVRALVRFAPHNLARDPIPPLGEEQFDVVVCRNVLIYFDGETVERVIESLERAVRSEGMLILGSADTLCGTTRRLARLGELPLPRPLGALRRPAERSLRRPLGRKPEPEPAATGTLDAEANFRRGLEALEHGDPTAAAAALRRALYVDPTFGLAAFLLGRAHEAAGDPGSARRAYEQALRTIDLADERHDHLLEQVHLADVADACQARLAALGGGR